MKSVLINVKHLSMYLSLLPEEEQKKIVEALTEAYAVLSASEQASLLEKAMNSRICDLEGMIPLEYYELPEEQPRLDEKIQAAKQQASAEAHGSAQIPTPEKDDQLCK